MFSAIFSVELEGAISRHLWEGVGGSCAQTLGIQPTLGRLIGEEDAPSADAPGVSPGFFEASGMTLVRG